MPQDTQVTFHDQCPSIPADLKSRVWMADDGGESGFHYHFDGEGALHRHEHGCQFSFVTRDGSGAMRIWAKEIGGAQVQIHWITIHCGRIAYVSDVLNPHSNPGFYFPPTWEMYGARQHGVAQAFDQSDIESNVRLIQAASLDPSLFGGSLTSSCMIGLALCRPDMLQGTDARSAWAALTDIQRAAIQTWATT